MTVSSELASLYRELRQGATREPHTRVEDTGSELNVYFAPRRIMQREMKRGLSYEARKRLNEAQRADAAVRADHFQAPRAKDALTQARSILKRRALGLDGAKFEYIGECLEGESEPVLYRADLPTVNGTVLAVLVKDDPEAYYERDMEGEFLKSPTYDYQWRGVSTHGPRRLRDFTILTTREREYRMRNEGAPSGGHGGWGGESWSMYYQAMDENDHVSLAHYYHKQGMARHAAWVCGMASERNLERCDTGEQSVYYVELREMTLDGGDVVSWEGIGGVTMPESIPYREEMEYLAETAYDMMGAELQALVAPQATPSHA